MCTLSVLKWYKFTNTNKQDMKQMKLVGLAVGVMLAVGALAAGLENAKQLKNAALQCSKEEPQLVVVYAGKQAIAELKILKPGTLDIETGDVTWFNGPGGGKSYHCTAGSKLEVSIEGKPVLTVSGDSMLVQNLKSEFKSIGIK